MLPPRHPCRRRRPFERGRRQAQRGDVGGGREAAALSIVGEMTEVHVGKVQFGASRRVEPQADAFAGEGVTDVIVAAFVREVAGAGDDFDLLVSGIDRYAALGLVGLQPRSHQPHHSPQRTDEAIEALILAERRLHRTWGPKKLQAVVARKHAIEQPPACSQMFVAGLATDAELFAQLGHGKAPATGEYNESIDLFHIGYVGPGHRPITVHLSWKRYTS